eukprot:5227061-Prymnesium_polylepis.1
MLSYNIHDRAWHCVRRLRVPARMPCSRPPPRRPVTHTPTVTHTPYVNSLTAEERHRSTYVAIAGTAERHTTAVLGQAQRGEPGDGPRVFADGLGY